jgi:hypothetical protein
VQLDAINGPSGTLGSTLSQQMDSSLIAPAVAAITSIAITSIVDPATRAYEKRTKRLQYLRTFMEVAPSVGFSSTDDVKELLRQEIVDAYEEMQKFKNKLAAQAATMLALIVMFLIFQPISVWTYAKVKPLIDAHEPEAFVNNIYYSSFGIDLLVAFCLLVLGPGDH